MLSVLINKGKCSVEFLKKSDQFYFGHTARLFIDMCGHSSVVNDIEQ